MHIVAMTKAAQLQFYSFIHVFIYSFHLFIHGVNHSFSIKLAQHLFNSSKEDHNHQSLVVNITSVKLLGAALSDDN